MSESACHAAGGEGRARDQLAQVHHAQLRNTSDCLAGDLSGKASTLICLESTMSLYPCFREASPACCTRSHLLDVLHLLQYTSDHQHMRVGAAGSGKSCRGINVHLQSIHLHFAIQTDFNCNRIAPESIRFCPGLEPFTISKWHQFHLSQGDTLEKGKRGEKTERKQ